MPDTYWVCMSLSRPVILCLASYFKGVRFLQAAHELGCHVILLTKEKLANEDWPMASIDERFLMADLSKKPDIFHAVSYLAREREIDRIVPLDDYDVETAAALREHLRLPGIGDSLVRHFRDKLAMRDRARAKGILVPEFTGVFNYAQVAAFMARVPGPWVLKPRSEAGAMGIKKISRPDQLWAWLNQLGDQQSFFLLEQYVAGEVYHLDSLVWDGQVVFAAAQKYGRPPMNVSHEGGVFVTRTLAYDSAERAELLALNQRLQSALGMYFGAAHTEYIKGQDGQWYFLETAARVGGANIDQLVEEANGLNPWAEWASIEVAHIRGETYQLPPTRQDYAGLLVCLARQEWPNLGAYADPEVVWRMKKKYHAGLIVRAGDPGRVQSLLNSYVPRFAHDFLAVAPPLDKAPQ